MYYWRYRVTGEKLVIVHKFSTTKTDVNWGNTAIKSYLHFLHTTNSDRNTFPNENNFCDIHIKSVLKFFQFNLLNRFQIISLYKYQKQHSARLFSFTKSL